MQLARLEEAMLGDRVVCRYAAAEALFRGLVFDFRIALELTIAREKKRECPKAVKTFYEGNGRQFCSLLQEYEGKKQECKVVKVVAKVSTCYKKRKGRIMKIRVAVNEQAPQTGEAIPPGSQVALAAPSTISLSSKQVNDTS